MSLPPNPVARRGRTPTFVENQTYRRRRMVDAARVLPAVGLLLWLLPMLWTPESSAVPMSRALIYVFGVWVALSVLAALVIRAIRRLSAPDRPDSAQDKGAETER